jgi:hypothetical protein
VCGRLAYQATGVHLELAMSTMIVRCLASCLAVTLAAPSQAWASEPASASSERSVAPVIGVRVEHEGLSEAAAAAIVDLPTVTAGRLADQYGSAESPSERGRRVLVVYVGPGPFEGDYLLRLEAHLDGELVGDAPPQPCLSCSTVQLADAIDAVAAGLVTRFPEPATSVKEEPEPSTDEPAPGDRPASDRTRRGPLLPTGISLAVIGVAGLATGVGLIAAHERVEPDIGQSYLRVVDYRPAGVAVAAVGGAVLITGIALLAVGAKRRQDSRASLVPGVGPGFAGAVVSGRF